MIFPYSSFMKSQRRGKIQAPSVTGTTSAGYGAQRDETRGSEPLGPTPPNGEAVGPRQTCKETSMVTDGVGLAPSRRLGGKKRPGAVMDGSGAVVPWGFRKRGGTDRAHVQASGPMENGCDNRRDIRAGSGGGAPARGRGGGRGQPRAPRGSRRPTPASPRPRRGAVPGPSPSSKALGMRPRVSPPPPPKASLLWALSGCGSK